LKDIKSALIELCGSPRFDEFKYRTLNLKIEVRFIVAGDI